MDEEEETRSRYHHIAHSHYSLPFTYKTPKAEDLPLPRYF